MGIMQWFRNRKAQKAATGPLGDQGKFYYLMSYEEEYSDLTSKYSDSDQILAELFLFRFWLTQCGYRLCKPDAITDDDLLNDMIPNGLTLGRGTFERLNTISIEETLGESMSELMEDRFHTYDAAFISGKSNADPFGLGAASLALANNILDDPRAETVAYLTKKAEEQFAAIFSTWSGGDKAKKPTSTAPPATSGSSPNNKNQDWLLVNEFDGGKVLINKSTIKRKGDLTSVVVLYDLNPSGTDSRNNKLVKKMINLEEYDLAKGIFQVHRIDFVYEDGSNGDPLQAVPQWAKATAGNAKTLTALKRLAAQGGS